MAHGKSLEPKETHEPKLLCRCGVPWEGHLKKDGTVLKKFANEKHGPLDSGPGRSRLRRVGVRGNGAALRRANLSRSRKALPALATHMAVEWSSLSDEQKRAAIKQGVEPPRGKRKLVTVQMTPEVFRR